MSVNFTTATLRWLAVTHFQLSHGSVRLDFQKLVCLAGLSCWSIPHPLLHQVGHYFCAEEKTLVISGPLYQCDSTLIPAWVNNYIYSISQEICTRFVVLCFVVVMQLFIMNSHEVFIHIHQGCFAGTGAIVRLPQCQWSKPDGYGTISQCITTTKHNKAKTVCIFFGIYCSVKCGENYFYIPKFQWHSNWSFKMDR